METLREAYKQALASAALEGIEPPNGPPELIASREDWLSGKITGEQYFERLNEHYRAVAKSSSEK